MSLKKERFIKGIILAPDSLSLDGIEGEVKVDSSTGKIQVTLKDGVNPSASREIITNSQTQTLTNKTITSPVINTGISGTAIDIDGTLAANSDTLLASQKAIKTYVDTKVGTKDEASEIAVSPTIGGFTGNVQATLQGHQDLIDDLVTLSGVAANSENLGSFTGITIPDNSTVKAALQSIETELETKAESSDLTTHTGASSSVHGVTGSVVGTSDSQALTNKTIDADLNTISNIENADIKVGANIARSKLASGTANRVVVNDVTGIQTDAAAITAARVLISDANGIPTHSTITSTTLSYLDATSSIQNQLDAKVDESSGTLTNGSIITPSRLDVKQDTYANLLTYASSASNGQLCFATDTKSMYQVVDGNLVSVGSGSGTSDTIFVLDGTELISNWSTGNNSSFLGGGTISGTFAKETVSPLNGLSSYKYTQAAGSLNDYIASPAQSVANRFKGQDCILSFPFNYNGNNNDIEVVIYDVTNSAVIPTSFFLEGSTSTKVFKGYVTIPTICSSIRVGFKVSVLNSGKILNFDDIQLGQTSLYIPQPESQHLVVVPSVNVSSSNILGNAITSIGSGLFSYNSSTGVYTVLKRGNFNLHMSGRTTTSASTSLQIFVDEIGVSQSDTTIGSGYEGNASYSAILNVGSTFRFFCSGSPSNASETRTSVLATSLSDQILTAPETFSTDTAPLTYAGSGTYTLTTLANAPIGTFITYTFPGSSYTPTQTTTAPTQFASGYADANSNGIRLFAKSYSSPSTAASPARISLQIGKGMKGVTVNGYSATSKTTPFTIDTVATSSNSFGPCITYNELTGILDISVAEMILSTGTKFVGYDSLGGSAYSSGYFVINASKNPALTGVPALLPRIATLSDVKASGTEGGTATSGAYQTRTLNTISDPTGIVTSLTSNQFVLAAGEYYIEASAPTRAVNNNKIKIRNITDSTDAIIGSNAFAGTNGSSSVALGNIVITSSKTFELQHRVQTTTATNGFGSAAAFGESEVYSIVKITKVK